MDRYLKTIIALIIAASGLLQAGVDKPFPNIVIMLADDMGFGELSCLNPDGKIATPQLDSIARSGMTFRDAHSGSSVCTPTRYGLMTGRYAWRTRLQNGVLRGGESLIAKDTLTIADLLKSKGYDTVMIGKWHLGMMFDGIQNDKKGAVKPGAKVTHGPVDFGGFDEFYGFHYARQMDLWIENDRVTRNIEAVDMLPALTAKAVEYIEKRRESDRPFFMYVPWNSPHAPVVPSEKWKGKSGLNDHADFVMQTDDSYGQVVRALRNNGFLENTLIICSSDNGTSPSTSGKKELEAAGHYSSGKLRGMKADIWDGGHRVPFLVSWPGMIEPGSECDDLVCLTDVIATVADLVRYKFSEADAVDSFSFLPALTGNNPSPRKDVIHHSISGYFAIRSGKWKLIACPGSGGWADPRPEVAIKEAREKDLPMYQLYDMEVDTGEQHNLVEAMPEVVEQMKMLLHQQIADGRTTTGPIQRNDVPVIVEKWAVQKSNKKS